MSLDSSVIRHNGVLAVVEKCRITREDVVEMPSSGFRKYRHVDEVYVDMVYYYIIDNEEKKSEMEMSGVHSVHKYMRDQFEIVQTIKKSGGYLDGITINKKMYLATAEFAEKLNFIKIR
jgi:hypothetical protein